MRKITIATFCVCLVAARLQAAFIVEAHESGLANDNFEFGGDTFSATASLRSFAVGTTASNSIFGGDGNELPDTYIFSYTPGDDDDNWIPEAGTVLGSMDGSPGEGNEATGIVGGGAGRYAVYITSPASVNVSGVPSLITLTQNGDAIEIENDQNSGATGDDTQVTQPGPFVGGMNNAWLFLDAVELVEGETYTLTMEAGANTFVSQRVHGVMWERIDGAAIPGDFNGDGMLDAIDINLLTSAVIDGDMDAKFDVNKDGDVDQDDRTTWVKEIRRTFFGDSNLDLEFNSSDFVTVFQKGEYEDELEANSVWETGDWNGDREFDSSDFVRAFQDGGFEQGPLEPANVPEPTSLSWLMIVCVGLLRIRVHGRNT